MRAPRVDRVASSSGNMRFHSAAAYEQSDKCPGHFHLMVYDGRRKSTRRDEIAMRVGFIREHGPYFEKSPHAGAREERTNRTVDVCTEG
jgi:hypothetical protein